MGILLSLLTMIGPLRALKFWVAAIMAFVQFLQIYSGINLGLDQGTVTTVLAGIGALLVWAVPNLKPKLPTLTEAEVRAQTGYVSPIEDRSGR